MLNFRELNDQSDITDNGSTTMHSNRHPKQTKYLSYWVSELLCPLYSLYCLACYPVNNGEERWPIPQIQYAPGNMETVVSCFVLM